MEFQNCVISVAMSNVDFVLVGEEDTADDWRCAKCY